MLPLSAPLLVPCMFARANPPRTSAVLHGACITTASFLGLQGALAANITLEQGKTLADGRGDVFRGLGASPSRMLASWGSGRVAHRIHAHLHSSGLSASCRQPTLNLSSFIFHAFCMHRGGGVLLQHRAGPDGGLCGECCWRHGHLQHPAAARGEIVTQKCCRLQRIVLRGLQTAVQITVLQAESVCALSDIRA